MKRLLLAGTAFLGLAASGSAVRATPIDFTYTGSLVTFTVPTTDTYQILAFGAQGGNSNLLSIGAGGRGAEIGGDLVLSAGEMLQIAVGGAGSDGLRAGAGGGGSFVVGPANAPLVVSEPETLALLGSALIGLAVLWRRRRPGTFGLRRG